MHTFRFMTESRPVRIMRALAAAPNGLSTPAIVAELAEGVEPKQRALCWYGGILRNHVKMGHVEQVGKTPGGWQRRPAIVWAITEGGRELLAYIDDAPARDAAYQVAQVQQAEAVQLRTTALAEAASVYSPRTPRMERRPAAIRLRTLGCTLEEIGQIFGVTREMIRQDCLPYEARPERAVKLPGPRFMDAAVRNETLAIKVGQRTIYLTRDEAARLAGIIGRWDSEPSAVPAQVVV